MEPIIPNQDTIAAISTPAGVGGIAIIRVSGPDAIQIVNKGWKGKSLTDVKSHTLHLGEYISLKGDVLDQCVAAVYKSPNSFTGEDIIELNVHGARWIQKAVLTDLVNRGVRIAAPGEFTQRAFMNGRMDLAQAEGVADLISSSSGAAHAMAIKQMRGGFSHEIEQLKNKLIDFASLLELELDFSEEDVEFADRTKLKELAQTLIGKINHLLKSYAAGTVFKEGVKVVIAGQPNAGKSSLLNLLLNEDKAIVSDIPGTTRDTIEDTIELDGILYRFTDTAGLRETKDEVENLGIERTLSSISKADIILWIIDVTQEISNQLKELKKFTNNKSEAKLILLLNKTDIKSVDNILSELKDIPYSVIPFSTKTGEGLEKLHLLLKESVSQDFNPEKDIIVTNLRHYEALNKGGESLQRAVSMMDAGISADFIAQDIREAIHHLSEITGSISNQDILHTIFSRFCVGK